MRLMPVRLAWVSGGLNMKSDLRVFPGLRPVAEIPKT